MQYPSSYGKACELPLKVSFDAYELGLASADRLDDVIWDKSLRRKIPPYEDPRFLDFPEAVRHLFASHDAEFSIGNAGFYEAATNNPKMLPMARDAYLAVGLPSAAGLIARAIDLLALEGTESDDFLDREWSALDEAATDAGLWAGDARAKFAIASRVELQAFFDD